jgi:two-component system, chemotaxis family, CheB/CheR fusion protein
LFNAILIKVTGMFRDPESWSVLRARLEAMISAGPSDRTIRIWSAGCATGEEPYTLAMMLADLLGMDEYGSRVKIYATDIDEPSLAIARRGAYSGARLADLPDEYRERFFNPTGNDESVLVADVRRSVIFGRHDLLHDAPISRQDLIVCRNTLMYLNAEAQTQVLRRFRFALVPDGLLFLGRAEMMSVLHDLFLPVDADHRIFARDSTPRLASDGTAGAAVPVEVDRFAAATFDALATPVIVIGSDQSVVAANLAARSRLGVPPPTKGLLFQDLDISYRPLNLRPLVAEVRATGGPVVRHDIDMETVDGATWSCDVRVEPVVIDGAVLAVAVVFTDGTRHRVVREELAVARRDLVLASAQLQSRNEDLQTLNEELKSSMEELQTTNEQLQSANEELETINEELMSTNAELEDLNTEMQRRSQAFDSASALARAVLAITDVVVVAVDQDYRVEAWSESAERLWGIAEPDAIGHPLLGLAVGFPLDALRDALHDALKTGDTADIPSLQVRDSVGHYLSYRARIRAVTWTGGERGVVLVLEQPR